MFSAELFERPVHAGRSGRPFRRFLSASSVPAALPAELSRLPDRAARLRRPHGAAGRAGHSGCSRPDRADGAAGCTGSSRRPRCARRHWAYRTSRSDGCHRRRRPAGTAGHSRRSRSRRRGWRNRTDRPHRPTGYCGCSRRSRSYRRNGSYRPNRSYGSDWTERYARGGSCCRCDKRRGRRRAVQRAAGKSPRSGSPLDLSNKRCGASRTAIHI